MRFPSASVPPPSVLALWHRFPLCLRLFSLFLAR
ncbi:Uncharacterised protein [Vibrio cholerae]|nr:Uncharacterised protein [Vibrio cholerae]